jgi:hypothetical protein
MIPWSRIVRIHADVEQLTAIGSRRNSAQEIPRQYDDNELSVHPDDDGSLVAAVRILNAPPVYTV